LYRQNPNLKFVIPAANQNLLAKIRDSLNPEDHNNVIVLDGFSRDVLSKCDLALLASGTAALEAALFKKPMVVVYKVSFIASLLVRWTKSVDHFSMPNHLAESPIVPEIIQSEVSEKNIADVLGKLINDHEYRESMVAMLSPILDNLTGNGGEQAADAIVRFLQHD
jgi:lipid-A-disaccharide synthase